MTTELVLNSEWEAEDSIFLQVLAHILAGQNREQAACDLLEFALSEDPRNGDIMRALCGVYGLLERHDDAITMGDRALSAGQSGEDIARIKLVQSTAHQARGRTTEAELMMRDYITQRDQA
ncbi:MAG: hypothetical protein AAGG47_01595 [Pseudomonadota bacterium]